MICVRPFATNQRMQENPLSGKLPLSMRTILAVICLTCVTGITFTSTSAHAAPVLLCYATYAGETTFIETRLTSDPYKIETIDIGGRFTFKAEMNGHLNAINYIKIYAYFQTDHGDIPIHEASYYPPFVLQSMPKQITPFNRLYAGPLERELQYHCTLQDKK